MKTKNQTEHHLLELATSTAANEDGIASDAVRKQAWSPLEVWRTRVKTPPSKSNRPDTAQVQG
jgi:hypothetical protein